MRASLITSDHIIGAYSHPCARQCQQHTRTMIPPCGNPGGCWHSAPYLLPALQVLPWFHQPHNVLGNVDSCPIKTSCSSISSLCDWNWLKWIKGTHWSTEVGQPSWLDAPHFPDEVLGDWVEAVLALACCQGHIQHRLAQRHIQDHFIDLESLHIKNEVS